MSRSIRPATFLGLGLLAALLVALAAGGAKPAQAVNITVNTTDDELNTDGDCSLREAIASANDDDDFDACPVASGITWTPSHRVQSWIRGKTLVPWLEG